MHLCCPWCKARDNPCRAEPFCSEVWRKKSLKGRLYQEKAEHGQALLYRNIDIECICNFHTCLTHMCFNSTCTFFDMRLSIPIRHGLCVYMYSSSTQGNLFCSKLQTVCLQKVSFFRCTPMSQVFHIIRLRAFCFTRDSIPQGHHRRFNSTRAAVCSTCASVLNLKIHSP